MNTFQKVSVGLASIVALAVFALPMHGTRNSGTKSAALVAANTQPDSSPETPQTLQWDMAYGDRTPPSSGSR